MSRPRLCRRIRFRPRARFFKPVGVPLRALDPIYLTHEEAEALRLRYLEELNQTQAAKKMKTSQSTFQRILASAHKKIAQAIVRGQAIYFE